MSRLHARTDAATRAAGELLAWGGAALVVWWWSTAGGVTDLQGWQSGLTSLGRLTGLLASHLLLIQVLLMSRIPWLERAYGQDRLAAAHRTVGFTSFTLMLAHVVLISWGYAAGSLAQAPGTFWDLTVNSPGMLLALGGTLALVLTVVTSIRAARAKLRYESWHLLHLYAYLGVGLALPHQLWTGQAFTTSPAATAYWWGLWASAAAAVLVWRVALPIARSLRHGLRVTGVVHEGDDTWSVHMTGRHLHRLRVQPGQFFNWRFLTGRGWTRAHPYSLSAAPDGRSLRISVKNLGDDSGVVRRLPIGTRVLVEGPYGRLTPRARTQRKVAFIASGVGVTPIRALAEGLDYAPDEAVLLHRFGQHPLFADELTELADERGLRVLALPGPRRSTHSWLPEAAGRASDEAALRHWVPDIAERDVYLCGPTPWAQSVRRSLQAAGVPDAHVHEESFGW